MTDFSDWDWTSGNVTTGFPVIELLEHFATTPIDEIEPEVLAFLQLCIRDALYNLKAGHPVTAGRVFHLPETEETKEHGKWIRDFEIAYAITQLRNEHGLKRTEAVDIVAAEFQKSKKTIDGGKQSIYRRMLQWAEDLEAKGIGNPLKIKPRRGG